MPRQKPGHVVKAQQAQKVRTQGQAERDGPPENTDVSITLRFMRVLIILFASFELVAHSAGKVYNSRSRMSRGGILCPFCPRLAPAPPQVGRGTYSLPTGSAHADGGATGVKGAFLWRLDTVSLGKHQRNGVESQDRLTTTAQSNGAHAESKRKQKGGTPGEGSPLDSLLRL